jgi:hypothetical protein
VWAAYKQAARRVAVLRWNGKLIGRELDDAVAEYRFLREMLRRKDPRLEAAL